MHASPVLTELHRLVNLMRYGHTAPRPAGLLTTVVDSPPHKPYVPPYEPPKRRLWLCESVQYSKRELRRMKRKAARKARRKQRQA